MKINEITKNLHREDKLLCAATCKTSESFINQILNGRRSKGTRKAKRIVAELRYLAKINIESKHKKQIICK